MTEQEARSALEAANYAILPGKHIRLPHPDHDITATEMAFVNHLLLACNYTGFETAAMRHGQAAFAAKIAKDNNPYSYTEEGGRPRLEWNWGWEIAQVMAEGR